MLRADLRVSKCESCWGENNILEALLVLIVAPTLILCVFYSVLGAWLMIQATKHDHSTDVGFFC
jgi:hypothetical protein